MLRIAGVVLAAALLAIAAPLPAHAAATPQDPQAIVQGMVSQLTHDVNGHEAALHSDPARMDQIIDRVVLPNFDLSFASLLVLGPHAVTAPPAQRVAFQHAFHKALTRSFAKGLIDFDQVSVKVLPAKGAADPRHALVRTQVLQRDGSKVAVDYAFRKTAAGDWKIYDVIIEGISYITLYRSQVNSQIEKSGMQAVIERLETKGLIDVNQ